MCLTACMLVHRFCLKLVSVQDWEYLDGRTHDSPCFADYYMEWSCWGPSEKKVQIIVKASVLVSLGCCNKVPLGTEVYCPIILEARCPKWKCWQSHAPSETCGGILLCLFLPSAGSWAIFGILQLAAASIQSLPLSSHDVLTLLSFLSLASSYKDIGLVELGAQPAPVWSHPNLTNDMHNSISQ